MAYLVDTELPCDDCDYYMSYFSDVEYDDSMQARVECTECGHSCQATKEELGVNEWDAR